MWNHSSKSTKLGARDCSGDGIILAEKLEKHFDLTNYLNFLQNLFSQSTSDSEEGDGGSDEESKEQIGIGNNSQIECSSPSPSEVENHSKFLSSAALESTSEYNSENSIEPTQGRSQLTSSSYSSKTHPLTCLSDSSTCSSSFSSEPDPDESSLIPSDLTPMSDLELNNLLKKTNYMGQEDADQLEFLDDNNDNETTDSSDKKGNSKKKKKKSKKKVNTENNQRQNRPNSGGKGNGSSKGGLSGYGGGSSGGSSSLPDNSGNSNSGSSNHNSGSGGSSHANNSGRTRNQSTNHQPHDSNYKDAPLKQKMYKSNSSILKKRTLSDLNISKTSLKTTLNNLLAKNKSHTFCMSNSLYEDDNDNDSLSDFMSMAATAASQVPALPQNSNDGYFDFGESLSNSNGPLSISEDSSSNNKASNSDTLTHNNESIKRKRDSDDDDEDRSNLKTIKLQQYDKMIELLNNKRRKIYVFMCRKEIPKAQRNRFNSHKEMLAIRRRLSQSCTKFVRQKAIQSDRTTKESVWRAKRLTREMQAFWRQADKVDKEIRKKKEKEMEEHRKQNEELLETKRYQQQINFLLTQTELYTQIVSRKLKNSTEILEDVDAENEKMIFERLRLFDNPDINEQVDDHELNSFMLRAKSKINTALKNQNTQMNGRIEEKSEFPQPMIFNGILKNYQLKGMNWLIDIYNHDINGILADEMGLGKTVQSIAFLAHVSEQRGIWGPFLIIAPSTSLQHWQLEIKRFVPNFKVIPYWGNPQERKILRQFWEANNLHTEEASFHVVITSYNLIVQDIKYFNKVKWQYMILDEAQAIKSTSSSRLKMLLGFGCQNRLLLTGTLNDTSASELWRLLYFLMPSLLDCDEFSEWNSKDSESNENQSQLNERHFSRLLDIVKSYILRRVKKDVEHELNGKIEIMIPCPLAARQKCLYLALKRKILSEDLIKLLNPSITSPPTRSRHLTNLVMQFKKVCNHPDIFERRDVKSPLFMIKIQSIFPKQIFGTVHRRNNILENQFSVYNPMNIHYSLFPKFLNSTQRDKKRKIDDLHIANVSKSSWSFSRFCGLSPSDIWNSACDEFLDRVRYLVNNMEKQDFQKCWKEPNASNVSMGPSEILLYPDNNTLLPNSSELPNLIFTSYSQKFYTWSYRTSKSFLGKEITDTIRKTPVSVISDGHSYLFPESVPKIFFSIIPKVVSEGFQLCFLDGNAQNQVQHKPVELNYILYGKECKPDVRYCTVETAGGLLALDNIPGWSNIVFPDKEKLITDSGKLFVLDELLRNLKESNHRVLIYSQMAKMLDILEEFLKYRKYVFGRLDGHSKTLTQIDSPDDNVFVYLLSTRICSMGINLTTVDTVIFFDNDANLASDKRALDRVNGLGQTKHISVYRLICKDTIEEKIFKHQSEITKTENDELKSDVITSTEFLSFVFDDDELERKYLQRQVEKRLIKEALDKKLKVIPQEKSTETINHEDKEISTDVTLTRSNSNEDYTNIGDASSGASVEGSLPSSDDSELLHGDLPDACEYEEEFMEINPSTSSYFDDYSSIEWNSGSVSDYEEDMQYIPKKPKLGRGTGKRGRPPSRIRVQIRDLNSSQFPIRRGPGRPRLKPIGPSNQGIRGRRPGRPPLSKKAESISSSLTPLTASQRVFGIYSSPDIDMS